MKSSIGSFSWVKVGRQRRVVIMAMNEDEMIPTEISANTKKYGKRVTLSNLSGVLKEFVNANILTYKNKITTNGRLYSLTEKGKKYRERLHNSPLLQKVEQS